MNQTEIMAFYFAFKSNLKSNQSCDFNLFEDPKKSHSFCEIVNYFHIAYVGFEHSSSLDHFA